MRTIYIVTKHVMYSYLLHTYNKDNKVQCPGRLSSHCMPRPTHCGTDVSAVTDSNVSYQSV